MATTTNSLKVVTFNCRSVKSSVSEVKELCDEFDIVMLQEHWLMPHELGLLSLIHQDFLSVAKSAVNETDKILVGRPYGGTAILFRKSIASGVTVIESSDPRVCAVKLHTNYGPVLCVCVYMPTDKGDAECVENYIATSAYITALCEECDVTQYVIAGDFNCPSGSRFHQHFQEFTADNSLCMCDVTRLNDVVTFCNDAGSAASWIDHILCTTVLDSLVCNVAVLERFVSSDHKPLAIAFHELVVSNGAVHGVGYNCVTGSISTAVDWSKADDTCVLNYEATLDNMLKYINIPLGVLNDCCVSDCTRYEIDNYYDSVMSCITNASHVCLPTRQLVPMRDYVIPGWNEHVSDKHKIARDAYLAWAALGRPRSGPEHWLMKRTRAQFKLALRYCKQHEQSIRSDMYAQALTSKDYKKFWRDIRKSTNSRSTVHAESVGGCHGDTAITDMWCNHYNQLYNSVCDTANRESVMQRIEKLAGECHKSEIAFTISDIAEACVKQKRGKAMGLDCVAMEAFMYGGHRLYVHLCMLFNMFLKCGYVPDNFMKCVIVPLVKCKTGDLNDVNNYRAISISTSISKLYESVLFSFIKKDDYFDAYQFGFTSGSSTSICTNIFKHTVDEYTQGGSHVFVGFLDFSKAFDKVNYWKLFHKLLDDSVNVSVVRLLAYWYSNQHVCIRWRDNLSQFFTLGNGTRQGGGLSPWLFARYIRDLLSSVVNSKIGCNIGGVFINILAYADDIVLLAPSWRGLQSLLDVVVQQSTAIDLSLNVRKSVCMVFRPRERSKVVLTSFPCLNAGGNSLQYVSSFKYLGHIINDCLRDDDDIQREIKNMFVRTNILKRKFAKCSQVVKVVLFKAYCVCLYDASLWNYFNIGSVNKLRSCYNRCIKIFFGYKRRDSLTNILLTLGLPSFDTVLNNACASFWRLWNGCNSLVVAHFRTLNKS